MKKTLAFATTLLIALSLTGCGKSEQATTNMGTESEQLMEEGQSTVQGAPENQAMPSQPQGSMDHNQTMEHNMNQPAPASAMPAPAAAPTEQPAAPASQPAVPAEQPAPAAQPAAPAEHAPAMQPAPATTSQPAQ